MPFLVLPFPIRYSTATDRQKGMQHREGEETAFKLPAEPAAKNKRSKLMKVYFADKQFWFEDFHANINKNNNINYKSYYSIYQMWYTV